MQWVKRGGGPSSSVITQENWEFLKDVFWGPSGVSGAVGSCGSSCPMVAGLMVRAESPGLAPWALQGCGRLWVVKARLSTGFKISGCNSETGNQRWKKKKKEKKIEEQVS